MVVHARVRACARLLCWHIAAQLGAQTPPRVHVPSAWQELSPYQAAHAVKACPDPLRYLSYVFGLGNLLAGPYLEYVDYRDFMEKRGVRMGMEEAGSRQKGLVCLILGGRTALAAAPRHAVSRTRAHVRGRWLRRAYSAREWKSRLLPWTCHVERLQIGAGAGDEDFGTMEMKCGASNISWPTPASRPWGRSSCTLLSTLPVQPQCLHLHASTKARPLAHSHLLPHTCCTALGSKGSPAAQPDEAGAGMHGHRLPVHGHLAAAQPHLQPGTAARRLVRRAGLLAKDPQLLHDQLHMPGKCACMRVDAGTCGWVRLKWCRNEQLAV